MTEYVIKEVGKSLWMVFANRRSIGACAAENDALKLMDEHSALNNTRCSRKHQIEHPLYTRCADAPLL